VLLSYREWLFPIGFERLCKKFHAHRDSTSTHLSISVDAPTNGKSAFTALHLQGALSESAMLNNLPSIYEYSLFSPTPLNDSTHRRLITFIRLLSALIVMNVLDGLFTVVWVSTNRATEANPLMGLTLDIHPVLFIVVKISLVYLGAIILMRYWEKAFAVLSLAVAFCFYSIVLSYHCTMLLNLGLLSIS